MREASLVWDIKPFIGLGPVSFFMTPEQVIAAAELGEGVTTRQDGIYTNVFGSIYLPNFTCLDGKLIIVGASRRVKGVRWNDIDIFAATPIDVLRALEKANGGAIATFDTVVFEKFGLQLSGFYVFERSEGYDPASDEQDDRGLTVWERAAQQKDLSQSVLAPHIRRVTFF